MNPSLRSDAQRLGQRGACSDAETLELSAAYPLPARPDTLAAAPEGGAAYVLLGGVVWVVDRDRGRLVRTIPAGPPPARHSVLAR